MKNTSATIMPTKVKRKKAIEGGGRGQSDRECKQLIYLHKQDIRLNKDFIIIPNAPPPALVEKNKKRLIDRKTSDSHT
jgi:hypothetical protein